MLWVISIQRRVALPADRRGFALVELLIVVAIIGILAAIAVPGYIGIQEKSRRSVLLRSMTSSIPEIQIWLQSSRMNQGSVEVDTNASGSVGDGDLTNGELHDMGVEIVYVAAKWDHGDRSPWNGTQPMWYTADPGATDNYGYIVLSSTTQGLRIQAYTKGDITPISDRMIFAGNF
jgi:prepilin-type N-terminal cleavage/methylation domain-containing protein